MSSFERFLPIYGMICIGTMWIDGATTAGFACVAAVVGFYYLRYMAGQKK